MRDIVRRDKKEDCPSLTSCAKKLSPFVQRFSQYTHSNFYPPDFNRKTAYNKFGIYFAFISIDLIGKSEKDVNSNSNSTGNIEWGGYRLIVLVGTKEQFLGLNHSLQR